MVGELRARGFAVWTLDWRGQGLSERLAGRPQAGYIDDFATYLEDLETALAQTLPSEAPELRIVLAHSMGGHLAARALAEKRLQPAAAILSAPMLRIAHTPAKAVVVPVLARLATLLGLGRRYAYGERDYGPHRCRFDGNPLTGDAVRFQRTVEYMGAEPALRLGGVTWGWLDAAHRSSAALNRSEVAAAIDLPVLLLLAADDTIVDKQAIAAFGAWLPHGRLVRLDDARHEPLIETDAVRARLWSEVDAFLAALPGAG